MTQASLLVTKFVSQLRSLVCYLESSSTARLEIPCRLRTFLHDCLADPLVAALALGFLPVAAIVARSAAVAGTFAGAQSSLTGHRALAPVVPLGPGGDVRDSPVSLRVFFVQRDERASRDRWESRFGHGSHFRRGESRVPDRKIEN